MFCLHEQIAARPPENERFHTIAIDGRGGSGKSSLAEYLRERLPHFIFIDGDGYFEPIAGSLAWGAFNERQFEKDVLAPLRVGTTFRYGFYDWHAEPHVIEQELTVTTGLCIDRCFSFGFDLSWDIQIWVETPREICLERGVARDAGVGESRARQVWETVWQPAEDRYIERLRPLEVATFVVDGTRPFADQIDV